MDFRMLELPHGHSGPSDKLVQQFPLRSITSSRHDSLFDSEIACRKDSGDLQSKPLPAWATGKTFLYMEGRRLQRMANGHRTKQDLFSIFIQCLAFVGLLYLIQMLPHGKIHRTEGLLVCIPIAITALLLLQALWQSCNRAQSVPVLHWCWTWMMLLVIWVIWMRITDVVGSNTALLDCPLDISYCSSEEGAIWIICPVLVVVTWLQWLVLRFIYPAIARKLRCRCAFRKVWWNVRRSRTKDGWMSYRPFGYCCSFRRHRFLCQVYPSPESCEFRETESCTWAGDSLYSETFRGMFTDGIPSPPFITMVKGTGAVSVGLQVGLATARGEYASGRESDRDRVFWCPKRRPAGLVYDIIAVECSVAGAFHAHLPQILPRSSSQCTTSRLKDVLRNMVKSMPIDAESPQPSPGLDHWVRARSFEAAPTLEFEAVVFIPGYNCSAGAACMRFGQLLALGNFDRDVVPFVFSWSNGQGLSYFQAERRLPEVAADFPDFLAELKRVGVSTVHIIAHSLGCMVVTEVLRPVVEAMQLTMPTIGTVSLINAICDKGQLMNIDFPVLLETYPGLRITLYCDRDDFALFIAEVTTRLFRSSDFQAVGCRPAPIGQVADGWSDRVDVIDCTAMDANAAGLRHGYYCLNPQVVHDIRQLICTQNRSARARQLMPVWENVYTFLAPPSHVSL